MPQIVWFLTLPGVMALDLTGPAETFARQLRQRWDDQLTR